MSDIVSYDMRVSVRVRGYEGMDAAQRQDSDYQSLAWVGLFKAREAGQRNPHARSEMSPSGHPRHGLLGAPDISVGQASRRYEAGENICVEVSRQRVRGSLTCPAGFRRISAQNNERG